MGLAYDWLTISQEFNQVIDTCVAGLKASFRDGLEEKCQIGATNVRPLL